MDDDTIPEPDALAELLAAPARLDPDSPPTLLASKVVWRDGRVHPMNAPWPERTRMERVIDGAERGLIPLRFATFVSLLVHRGAVDRHGLPYKHFFIWSDDVEYTSRAILGGDLAYLVPTSLVVHKTETAHFFMSAPPERFYYHVRNTLFMMRAPGTGPQGQAGSRAGSSSRASSRYLLKHRSAASVAAVLRGLRDGLRPAAGRLAAPAHQREQLLRQAAGEPRLLPGAQAVAQQQPDALRHRRAAALRGGPVAHRPADHHAGRHEQSRLLA